MEMTNCVPFLALLLKCFISLILTDHPLPSSKDGAQGQKINTDERKANGGTLKSL